MFRRISFVVGGLAGLTIAGCFGATQLFAQSQAPASQAWSDHQRRATVSIGILVNPAHPVFQPICTGEIVAANTTTAFLVSAKHCFESVLNLKMTEIRIRFAWEQREAPDSDLGTQLQIVSSQSIPLWTSARDGHDVAAINIAGLLPRAPRPPNGVFEGLFINDFAGDSDLFDGEGVFCLRIPGLRW